MIYLDNAATSFPKPPMVVRAMAGTLQKLGGNPGRSGHALSLCGGRIIQRCRELLAEAFDAPAPQQPEDGPQDLSALLEGFEAPAAPAAPDAPAVQPEAPKAPAVDLAALGFGAGN